jgi:hypothetical protein
MAYITFQIEDELKEKFEDKVKIEERTVSSALRLLIKKDLGEND